LKGSAHEPAWTASRAYLAPLPSAGSRTQLRAVQAFSALVTQHDTDPDTDSALKLEYIQAPTANQR